MSVIEVNENNKDEYRDAMGYMAENIGRDFITACVVPGEERGTIESGIMWQLINANDPVLVYANVIWLKGEKGSAFDELFAAFVESLEDIDVKRASFEFTPEELTIDRDTLTEKGFQVEDREGQIVEVTLQQVVDSYIMKIDYSIPDNVSSISDLMPRHYRRGMAGCISYGAASSQPDMATLPMSWFDDSYSSYVSYDGKPTGFFLLHRRPAGEFEVQFFFAYGADYRKDLMFMARYSAMKAYEELPHDTKVWINRHSAAVERFKLDVFPDISGKNVIAGTLTL